MKDGTYRTKDLDRKRFNTYYSGVNYASGYQVGTHEGTWLKIPASVVGTPLILLRGLMRCVDETGAPYVGIWTDDEGKVHIDPSEYFEDRGDAMRAGKAMNQICVWNWETMTSEAL